MSLAACSILGWGYLAPWIKQLMQASMGASASVDAAFTVLTVISTVLWLVPVYFISYRLSCDWCLPLSLFCSHMHCFELDSASVWCAKLGPSLGQVFCPFCLSRMLVADH